MPELPAGARAQGYVPEDADHAYARLFDFFERHVKAPPPVTPPA